MMNNIWFKEQSLFQHNQKICREKEEMMVPLLWMLKLLMNQKHSRLQRILKTKEKSLKNMQNSYL